MLYKFTPLLKLYFLESKMSSFASFWELNAYYSEKDPGPMW